MRARWGVGAGASAAEGHVAVSAAGLVWGDAVRGADMRKGALQRDAVRGVALRKGVLRGDCMGVGAAGRLRGGGRCGGARCEGEGEGECGRGSAGGGPNVPNSDSAGHHDEDDEDTRVHLWRGHCNPRRPPLQESGMSFIFSSTHVRA